MGAVWTLTVVKIVTFFLIGIAILGLFGRLKWPSNAPRLPKPRKCPKCNRYLLTDALCNCQNRGKK